MPEDPATPEADGTEGGDNVEGAAVGGAAGRASESESEGKDLVALIGEGSPDEKVLAEIRRNPDAVQVKDSDGLLPLHVAAWKQTSGEVVNALLDAYREGAREKNNNGGLPLHFAAFNQGSWEVVKALLEAYPKAAREKDNGGSLPLFIAASNNASGKVVKALLGAYPKAAREKDIDGMLPLHCAAQYQASGEVVKALLGAYPKAAREKDIDGMLPLQHALANQASGEVAKALLDAYPEAAREKDNHGLLPLHVAIERRASGEVEKALLDAYPEAAREKTNDGLLPLHPACAAKASAEVVKVLLDANFDAAMEKNSLPLHLATRNQASGEVVKALLAEYPEAAREKDNKGRLPLHIAAYNQASGEVVKALLDAYPEAAREKTNDGSLPLHPACAAKASAEVVKVLLDANSDAAKEKNKLDSLPLHLAARNQASVEVVKALLDAYPETARVKTNDQLPLHCAAVNQASGEVVKVLLDAYPEAAGEKDNCGKLPLHHTAENYASGEVAKALLDAYPEAAREKDDLGRLPVHYAALNLASGEVVKALLDAYPDTARMEDEDGKTPLRHALDTVGSESSTIFELLKQDMPVRISDGELIDHSFSWTHCLRDDGDSATAAVLRILDPEGSGSAGYCKFMRSLAEICDEEGRPALDIASAKLREEIHKHILFCGRYKLQVGAPVHRSATCVVIQAEDYQDKPDYDKLFDEADKDNSASLDKKEIESLSSEVDLDSGLFINNTNATTINKVDFVRICKQELGDGPRKVVIKFMLNEDQWQHEKDARKNLDANYVVRELTNTPTKEEIEKAVKEGKGGLHLIKNKYLEEGAKIGTHAIFMDAAERNLHTIFYQEQPKLEAIRDILRQLFSAVAHLHDKGLMHGDLKLLNVVRFHLDLKYRLIDFDAAVRIIEEDDEDGINLRVGAKFSSATLPPEMIYQLKDEEERRQIKNYWEGGRDEDVSRAEPKESDSGPWFVVKSFRTENGEPAKIGLPYDLEKPSEAKDVWGLGAISYAMFTGKKIVPSTRDDHCVTGEDMRVLCKWKIDGRTARKRLRSIKDAASRDLLEKMLHHNPSERPSIHDLLENHIFFNPDKCDAAQVLAAQNETNNKLDEMNRNVNIIKQLGYENKVELRQTREVLFKGIFEATEVDMPTTFIILPEKIPGKSSDDEMKMGRLEAAEGCSGFEMSDEKFSLTFNEDGMIIKGKGALKGDFEALNTGTKWVRRITNIGKEFFDGNVDGAFEIIKEGLGDLVTAKVVHLYLVDELTGDPVTNSGWPIQIKEPSEIVHKLLPVMQIGLRGMAVYNGVTGVARMCGFSVPHVPKAWADRARGSVDVLKQRSSVEKFGPVQEVLDSEDEKSRSLRGALFRVFKDFLHENDPGLKAKRDGDFAGLRRIGNPETGDALWTTLKKDDDIKKALKDRKDQRTKEEGLAKKMMLKDHDRSKEEEQIQLTESKTKSAKETGAEGLKASTDAGALDASYLLDSSPEVTLRVIADATTSAAKAATIAAEKAEAAANAVSLNEKKITDAVNAAQAAANAASKAADAASLNKKEITDAVSAAQADTSCCVLM